MKNILKISIIGCSLILLVGCGNKKTLKCSIKEEPSSITTSENVEVNFKKNEIANMIINIDVSFDEEYSSFMDSTKIAFDNEYYILGQEKGMSYTTTSNKNAIKMTLSADFDKMDDEARSSFNMNGGYQTYEEVKKHLEAQGYTCR